MGKGHRLPQVKGDSFDTVAVLLGASPTPSPGMQGLATTRRAVWSEGLENLGRSMGNRAGLAPKVGTRGVLEWAQPESPGQGRTPNARALGSHGGLWSRENLTGAGRVGEASPWS